MSKPLVLASGSPRRKQLLSQIGLQFVIAKSQVVETGYETLAPDELVIQLALVKARAVALDYPEALVIGADTIVVVDECVLGKPQDEVEAQAMLRSLKGREHQVYTGLAVVEAGREVTDVEMTRVYMRDYDDEEIYRYVATQEPRDKAGAYAIQGRGALLVSRIDGCYSNVVGLPLPRLGQLLREFGVTVL